MTSEDRRKDGQAICKVRMVVVVCSGLGFLLISRDLASGTRCLDLILHILFPKKIKNRDAKPLVP